MCARRFLGFVFVLTLLGVAGAFAIYQWGADVLLHQSVPEGHFEPAKAGTRPDYAQDSSWVAKPGLASDPTHWLPDNTPAQAPGNAAIFFIHPTTYLVRDRWNAPLHPDPSTESTTRLMVRSQASALSAAGEIWAPRYRQAAFGAFLLRTADAEKALDFAYRDISAAFDRFLAEAGDRPLILAGHSQGALHLVRLLRERVAGKPLARRIVAAYAVGWPISMTADLPALGLPACASPDQSGCLLDWQSFQEPANPDLVLDAWEKGKGPTGVPRRRDDMLCVNPITGTENGAAPASANAGTLIPNPNLRSATLAAGRLGAHCKRGLLIVDGDVPAVGGFVMPGNNYHAYDYALFWGAIRNDAERRLKAWHR
jgi:hypothetical protein